MPSTARAIAVWRVLLLILSVFVAEEGIGCTLFSFLQCNLDYDEELDVCRTPFLNKRLLGRINGVLCLLEPWASI